jgi:hypothetical protein
MNPLLAVALLGKADDRRFREAWSLARPDSFAAVGDAAPAGGPAAAE